MLATGRLRTYLDASGYTIADLSEKLLVSEDQIRKTIRGESDLDSAKLVELASLLNLLFHLLVDGDSDDSGPNLSDLVLEERELFRR